MDKAIENLAEGIKPLCYIDPSEIELDEKGSTVHIFINAVKRVITPLQSHMITAALNTWVLERARVYEESAVGIEIRGEGTIKDLANMNLNLFKAKVRDMSKAS